LKKSPLCSTIRLRQNANSNAVICIKGWSEHPVTPCVWATILIARFPRSETKERARTAGVRPIDRVFPRSYALRLAPPAKPSRTHPPRGFSGNIPEFPNTLMFYVYFMGKTTLVQNRYFFGQHFHQSLFRRRNCLTSPFDKGGPRGIFRTFVKSPLPPFK